EEKVGGSLYLSGLTSIPDGFNPTVGGYLYLGGSLRAETKEPPKVLTWNWNGGQYCCADGMFGEVISRRSDAEREIYKLRSLGRDDVFFLVEQNGITAHGDSIRDAMLDLRFKAEDRDPSDYEQLTAESELSLEDAVVCYRTITGACQFGVRDYLDNRLPKEKASYRVGEIIDLTANEYGGSTFAKFFE
ncbi:MAG: hypothetical protein MI757_03290, partial [Pirellulales bacterium]|nr:hypothetical protein [Pirellulales bacterium]